MLRCREVVDLVASDGWREAPLIRRLALAMHLTMCRYCRAYVRQLRRIAQVARELYTTTGADAETADRLAHAVKEAAEQGERSE
jgi:hypothetical protein